MEKQPITQHQIVTQLLKISHGKLENYKEAGLLAAETDPFLLSHMLPWNFAKGEVRDSKAALPVLSLQGSRPVSEVQENAVANLCLLDPRTLLKAVRFGKSLGNYPPGAGRMLKAGVRKYLLARTWNRNWWERTLLTHRDSVKGLFTMFHIKPSNYVEETLFQDNVPPGSVLAKVKQLHQMTPLEAAGTILEYKIPFQVAVGAVGGVKDKPDLVIALLEQMSGNQVVGWSKSLEKWGLLRSGAIKFAYQRALQRSATDKRMSSLKATRAAEEVADERIKEQLLRAQENRIDKLEGVKGTWAVLVDMSYSMNESIDLGKQIAVFLVRMAEEDVILVFFNERPIGFAIDHNTTLDALNDTTRELEANGNTSIGAGLDLIVQRNLNVDGIVVVSDGGENTRPWFSERYHRYTELTNKEPPIYFYKLRGDPDKFSDNCRRNDIQLETFDLRNGVDYYSLPNLVKTMKTNRYSLVEEILATPLLTLDSVFSGKEVQANA